MIYRLCALLVGMCVLGACGRTTTPAANSTVPTMTPSRVRTFAANTAAPTWAPSATPEPPRRFFSEDFSSDLFYWETFLTSGGTDRVVIIENGFLAFALGQPNTWAYELFLPYEYGDVQIEARFEPRAGEPSSTGVVCRYSKEEGWYEFVISRDGTYSILVGQWLAEDVARYTPILYDESEYIKGDQTGYEVGLGCQQEILWLYINGKLIRKVDVTRYGLTAGKIGLTTASFQNVPVISAFDWVEVSEP